MSDTLTLVKGGGQMPSDGLSGRAEVLLQQQDPAGGRRGRPADGGM
jgi:hypothetical protein